jgi:NAD-dependent SIR2 family protein deacetylase
MTKWCPGCQAKLPGRAFGDNKSTKDGRMPYCRACMARIVREHRVRVGKTQAGRKVGRPRKAAA